MAKAELKQKLLIGVIFSVLSLLMAVVVSSTNGGSLMTSVGSSAQHAPFDGTVYPIKKVPNWVKITSSNWDLNYADLKADQLIDIPFYNPDKLKTSSDDLLWGNTEHDAIRNAKITYSTPYMGSYLLDGKEYGGSHLAVDIKVPHGTPIYSIANGVVSKVKNQDSGFGYHIVIKHSNFPTLSNSDAKEVIYSSYSHLGQTLVSEGDVVKKGDKIAVSGSSGTATTPHLHFQIDNSKSPWQPFWPFTWQEASDAGLDFFTAVNAGLGQAKAIETTINPLLYVQKYLDGSNSAVADLAGNDAVLDSPELNPVPSNDVKLGGDNAESYVNNNETNTETAVKDEFVGEVLEKDFIFTIDSKYSRGKGSFTVDLIGVENLNGASISSLLGNVNVSKSNLNSGDFVNGSYTGEFDAVNDGRDRLVVEYEGDKYFSGWFIIGEGVEEVLFSDVSKTHKYYEGIKYLVDRDIIVGYPDNTFKPENPVSRVEALKFILEGTKATLAKGSLPFTDVSSSEWYYSYLYTAYKNGVIDGYDDKTFKPGNVVNRAEFFKILVNGVGGEIDANVQFAPFNDVPTNAWFAPYVDYAKSVGVIDLSNEKFRPGDEMTRGEVADAMWRLMTK